jgi:hypothetical protein
MVLNFELTRDEVKTYRKYFWGSGTSDKNKDDFVKKDCFLVQKWSNLCNRNSSEH